MWRKGSRPLYRGMQENSQMCQLLWRPPGVCKHLRKMEKRKRDRVCKIHLKHIFPRGTEDSRRYKHSPAVSSVTSTEPTRKYQNIVRKLQQLEPEDWPNFIKNLKTELEESKVKTKDGEKYIPLTQSDSSTQDTSQDKNTEWKSEKLPTDCTEHRRKIVLTRIQSKKDPGKNHQLNKLNDKKQK